MFRRFSLSLKFLKKPELLIFLILVVVEVIHLRRLFGGGQLLAGGDNYIWLRLGREKPYPYLWDIYYPFGVRSFTIANLAGLPLYGQIFGFLSPSLLQKLIIFTLHLLKYLAFYKLVKLFTDKISRVWLLPVFLLLTFNVFESLNPYTFHQLLYGVYLPFSLYSFIKILESNTVAGGELLKLLFLSLVCSPINSNTPLAVTVFLPWGLYLLLNFKKIGRIQLINLGLLILGWLVVNLWWWWPLFNYFLSVSNSVSTVGWFTATTAGSFYQNFRFIGQWGWYLGHFLYPYYPYNAFYDRPVVVAANYLLVGLAFYEALKGDPDRSLNRKRLFLLGLALISLLLVGGSRLPLGVFYQFFFERLSFFRIFREPFTKFSELYVLAVTLLLYLFLLRLSRHLSKAKTYLALLFFGLIVFLAIKPYWWGENVVSQWNGSVRTQRVSIPSYWLELEKYSQTNLSDQRLITTPKVTYGNAWNWSNGFSSADDLAPVFLGSNNVLRLPFANGSEGASLIDGFFEDLKEGKDIQNWLSLLSIDYVLQENDLDWRYSSEALDPTTMKSRLDNQLIRRKEFGLFSQNYLRLIPNGDPNLFVRQKLSQQLLGKPALVLYEVPPSQRRPKIYFPDSLVLVSKFSPLLLSESNSPLLLGRFQAVLNLPLSLSGLFPKVLNSGQGPESGLSWQEVSQTKPVQVNWFLINPTKYLVEVRGATTDNLIQFQESFDKNWHLYLAPPRHYRFRFGSAFLNEKAFETLSLQSLPNLFHFESNGFANAWLISADQLQRSAVVKKDNQGRLDYNLIIEYSPQREFYLAFGLMLAFIGLSAAVFLIKLLRRFGK